MQIDHKIKILHKLLWLLKIEAPCKTFKWNTTNWNINKRPGWLWRYITHGNNGQASRFIAVSKDKPISTSVNAYGTRPTGNKFNQRENWVQTWEVFRSTLSSSNTSCLLTGQTGIWKKMNRNFIQQTADQNTAAGFVIFDLRVKKH